MDEIYVDHAATTPIENEVLQYMLKYKDDCFANPSSIHSSGRRANYFLNKARENIANYIQANDSEIIFTSGGTEANNLAIIGMARKYKEKGNHLITTTQEHQATLKAMQVLEGEGFKVTYIPIDQNGIIQVEKLKKYITNETILFTTSYVNNETGMIQPIEEVGEILHEKDILFHVDAVQAIGLFPIQLNKMKIDALSASSHKIGGPKGIGLLYLKESLLVEPLLVGGNQEKMRRAGTENVLSILGFAKAMQLALENQKENYDKYSQYKKQFLTRLQEANISFSINGCLEKMSPHIINLSFTNIKNETMLPNLDLEKINASAGSACTAGTLEPSHVLKAMYGDKNERIKEAVRFSFGPLNDQKSIELLAERIIRIVRRLQK